ncbi:hypothetical protein DEO72_LG4g800 [Vigna unguiculata]|uniref:Uncharacterized protein n=1 Tax=Vigna unguiculata TaxID=3917 RepID=A0A4D6LMT7_VIGUN|nr:hypothetical protein DEO72_LG4g800 [Vigna unguiculata]
MASPSTVNSPEFHHRSRAPFSLHHLLRRAHHDNAIFFHLLATIATPFPSSREHPSRHHHLHRASRRTPLFRHHLPPSKREFVFSAATAAALFAGICTISAAHANQNARTRTPSQLRAPPPRTFSATHPPARTACSFSLLFRHHRVAPRSPEKKPEQPPSAAQPRRRV